MNRPTEALVQYLAALRGTLAVQRRWMVEKETDIALLQREIEQVERRLAFIRLVAPPAPEPAS